MYSQLITIVRMLKRRRMVIIFTMPCFLPFYLERRVFWDYTHERLWRHCLERYWPFNVVGLLWHHWREVITLPFCTFNHMHFLQLMCLLFSHMSLVIPAWVDLLFIFLYLVSLHLRYSLFSSTLFIGVDVIQSVCKMAGRTSLMFGITTFF